MKIYCISLPETPERFTRAINHFNAIKMPVEFIIGINARTFGLMTSLTYDFDHPDEGYHIPAKHVGLFLSHYIAWSIIAHQQDEQFMILEDDALFGDDWETQIQVALERAGNDFDILFIGSGNTFDKPKMQLNENIYDIKYPQCTHAYIIKKETAKKLLSEQRKVYAPIDLALIHDSFPNMKILTVLPRIANQIGQNIEP